MFIAATSQLIRSKNTALLQEVVAIKELMFGHASWRKSNAQSVLGNLIHSGHTNPITSRSMYSDMQRCSWLGALQIE